jgi:hypothetical protein
MHSHLDLKKSHFDSRNRVPDAIEALKSPPMIGVVSDGS